MSDTSSSQLDTFPRPGKTAIVTGGSSGIGRSCSIALTKAGWNVCVTGRRQSELDATIQEMQTVSGRTDCGLSVAGDITNEDVVMSVFKQTSAKFGRIDLVFANAGISPPNVPIMEQKLSDWQATVDVNLTAPWLCAREAFRYMSTQSPRGGRFIVNGSISAYTPRPHTEPYTATKHAMTGLTKSLSLDGRAYDIAVTQIDIGNAASEMTLKMKTGPGVLQANGEYAHEPTMDREHVAKSVVNVAEMPLSVNVANIIIQATKMPSYVGRG